MATSAASDPTSVHARSVPATSSASTAATAWCPNRSAARDAAASGAGPADSRCSGQSAPIQKLAAATCAPSSHGSAPPESAPERSWAWPVSANEAATSAAPAAATHAAPRRGTTRAATSASPTARSAEDAPSVPEILRPALYAAALAESLDGIERRNVDPREPSTQGFSREAMEPRVLAAFARGTSAPEAEAFAAWTRRPDVAPFLARERATGAPDFARTKADYLATHTPDPARMEAVRRFLDVTRYPAYARDFSLRAAVRHAAEASGEAPSAAELARRLSRLGATEGAFWHELSADRLAETYYVAFADASAEDIARFTEAARVPEAQWYFRRLPRAMFEAYDAALVRALQREA